MLLRLTGRPCNRGLTTKGQWRDGSCGLTEAESCTTRHLPVKFEIYTLYTYFILIFLNILLQNAFITSDEHMLITSLDCKPDGALASMFIVMV